MPRKMAGLAAMVALALAGCSGNGETITLPPGGVLLDYSPCPTYPFQPKLIAVQDGTGPWTAVVPAGNHYTATVSSSSAKVGLLEVTGNQTSSGVAVYYALASELKDHLTQACSATVTDTHGTVNSMAAGDSVSVSVGWNWSSVAGPGNQTFSVSTTSATADLVAVLSTASSPAARFILRRGLPLAPIDFTKGEDFAPSTPPLTITGVAGDSVTFGEWYQTAAGFRDFLLYGTASTTLPTSYFAMPAAKQLAGDLHELFAYTSQTIVGGVTSGRTIDNYWHDPVARTLSFAPIPAAPTLSFPTTAPYPQLRVQWTMPAGHSYFLAEYGNVSVYATAGYLGGGPVDLQFPDLTGVAGWQSSWMPPHGTALNVFFYDYTFSPTRSPLDYTPADGLLEQYNHWYMTITP